MSSAALRGEFDTSFSELYGMHAVTAKNVTGLSISPASYNLSTNPNKLVSLVKLQQAC